MDRLAANLAVAAKDAAAVLNGMGITGFNDTPATRRALRRLGGRLQRHADALILADSKQGGDEQ